MVLAGNCVDLGRLVNFLDALSLPSKILGQGKLL
jgi:hypothetical protein